MIDLREFTNAELVSVTRPRQIAPRSASVPERKSQRTDHTTPPPCHLLEHASRLVCFYETPSDALHAAQEFERSALYKKHMSDAERKAHSEIKEILRAWEWGTR